MKEKQKGVVVVSFRCSACYPLIADATADEREEKRQRLAKDVPASMEREMDPAPQKRDASEMSDATMKAKTKDKAKARSAPRRSSIVWT